MNAGFTELKTTKIIGNVSFYIGITIWRGLMLLRWLVRLKSTFYKDVGGI